MIKKRLLLTPFLAGYVYGAAAESYNPSWGTELTAVNNKLFNAPTGSVAWLEDAYVPWWQNRVANPITDYNAALLPTGAVRLDTALDVEYSVHRMLPSWTKVASPSGINNVYTFTPTPPGVHQQEDRTGRMGQAAFLDFGIHPIETISGDIGAELIGNYDQRYWHPVNDEHRMFNDDRWGKIVRADLKYDDGAFLLRGFESVPMPNWINKNDLFLLYPGQMTPEYARRLGAGGPLVPRGGQMRYKSDRLGTVEVIGGAEPLWDYGSGVYAKYDAPALGNWEQSLVYRNENITWNKVTINDPDERRWAMSYNSSYHHSDRLDSHGGIIYQPYRLNYTYADTDTLLPDGTYRRRSMTEADALGIMLRTEYKPEHALDQVGLGYAYLGRAAGNKQQVDLDGRRTFLVDWTGAGSYIYRQPISGPVPYRFEGTDASPGAILSTPRGPDDAFRVDWTSRKAHIVNLTLAFDPTPGTWMFKDQPNVLADYNLNPAEDATWTGAVQYTMTYYPTAMDRSYYFNEDRDVVPDPIAHTGAEATASPFSSATGLVQWKKDQWRTEWDLSFGEALAGAGIAYTDAKNYYKSSTVFMQTGMTVQYNFLKAFFRYGQNTWGPYDFHVQQGLIYKHLYQAGLSAQFLKQFEAGFRYVGTRQDDDYLGADLGAFNEYRFYLTWHFGVGHNFGSALKSLGKPLPRGLPEASLTASETEFTPDGSTAIHTVTLHPHAVADAGILSWRAFVRNGAGETVHQWDGRGSPERALIWDGLGTDQRPLPPGTYKATLEASDVYGNDVTGTPVVIELKGKALPPPPAPPAAPAATVMPVGLAVTTIAEGLRVTLNSLVLFDTGKAALKDSSRSELDQVVKLLDTYPANAIRISGHSDSTGSHALNQRLSEQRAQAVADYLQAHGVSKDRLRVVGWGETRPTASNTTEEGRQLNRRVEIDILK